MSTELGDVTVTVDLQKLRCLVLGGTGFIGRRLCSALVAKGAKVRSLTRRRILPFSPDARAWHSQIEWVHGTFGDPALIRNTLRNIDIIFHLFSTTLPATSNEDIQFDLTSNVLPTLQLLQTARDCGIHKVIFISSGGAIYGISPHLPVAEDNPTNPISAYGIHKLSIEKYLQLFHQHWQLDYGVLRVSNPYGIGQPVDRPQGVIAQFVHKAIAHEVLDIWGDGSATRDFIHIDDVIEAFLLLMHHGGPSRLFNIGSGKGHSLLEVISIIEAIMGEPVEVRFLPARSVDIPRNVLDISRAKSELGWSPRKTLEAGIQQMLVNAAQRPPNLAGAASFLERLRKHG